MILYNLSKALGLAGYYDECLEICEESIYLAKKTSRCSCLGEVLYNCAWALTKRDQEGDHALAAHYADQSRNFFLIMGNTTYVEIVNDFIKRNRLNSEKNNSI